MNNTNIDNSRYKKGILAENVAKIFLLLKGYKILSSRLKTPVGEIDILACKKDTFVVVEVKYRKTVHAAMYSITDHQKQRLIRAGSWVMSSYGATNIRFDVILISVWWLKHIENAFGQD